MTLIRDAPGTTELDPDNMPVGPEALFKEARRRRRRRWTITGLVVLAVVSVVSVIGIDVSGSGPNRQEPSGSHGGLWIGDQHPTAKDSGPTGLGPQRFDRKPDGSNRRRSNR